MHKFPTVFVTVGTTRFDTLLSVIDSVELQTLLAARGTSRLIVQYGESDVIPQSRVSSISVDVYAFKPNLVPDMLCADLIIAHCGAGTILDILRNEKKALCVVNSKLLDNHQVELADEMSSRSLMQIAYGTESVLSVLRDARWDEIKLYEKPNPTLFRDEMAHLVNIWN